MIRSIGRRAVVIGGGIGGLAAAGALANYFEHVEVLERDRLPESASPRSGTPQDRHPHGLLAGGLKALGDIFPGFERDLAEAGAIPVRLMQDLQYERVDVGVLPRRDFGLSIFCASRPLIEAVLRRRVLAVANITVRSECRVTAIVPLSVGEGIRGVRFDSNKASEQTLGADLVVDASGRGALTLAFLDELGWKRPEVTEVGVDISYATAVVQIPADAPPEWKLVLTLPKSAHSFDERGANSGGGQSLVGCNRQLWSDRASGDLEWLSRRFPAAPYTDVAQCAPGREAARIRLDTTLFPPVVGGISNDFPCHEACSLSPTRSAGSTQYTPRGCRLLPSKPDCCSSC